HGLIGSVLAVARLDQRAELLLSFRVGHWIARVAARELHFLDELPAVFHSDRKAVRSAGGVTLVQLGIAVKLYLSDQIEQTGIGEALGIKLCQSDVAVSESHCGAVRQTMVGGFAS